MKTEVAVFSNYYEELPIKQHELKSKFNSRNEGDVKKLFQVNTEITTKNSSFKQLKIFGFKKNKLEEESLILKLYAKEINNNEINYFVQTGLFAGVIFHKGCEFKITTKYGNVFLRRMLSFINDIYIDDQYIPV